jgi:hypothetical protein
VSVIYYPTGNYYLFHRRTYRNRTVQLVVSKFVCVSMIVRYSKDSHAHARRTINLFHLINQPILLLLVAIDFILSCV